MNSIVRIQPMQYIHLLDLVGTPQSQFKPENSCECSRSLMFVTSCKRTAKLQNRKFLKSFKISILILVELVCRD